MPLLALRARHGRVVSANNWGKNCLSDFSGWGSCLTGGSYRKLAHPPVAVHPGGRDVLHLRSEFARAPVVESSLDE
eukprot:3362115-Pyramimonas_sp.AAC.1